MKVKTGTKLSPERAKVCETISLAFKDALMDLVRIGKINLVEAIDITNSLCWSFNTMEELYRARGLGSELERYFGQPEPKDPEEES